MQQRHQIISPLQKHLREDDMQKSIFGIYKELSNFLAVVITMESKLPLSIFTEQLSSIQNRVGTELVTQN